MEFSSTFILVKFEFLMKKANEAKAAAPFAPLYSSGSVTAICIFLVVGMKRNCSTTMFIILSLNSLFLNKSLFKYILSASRNIRVLAIEVPSMNCPLSSRQEKNK